MKQRSPTGHSYKFLTQGQKWDAGRVLYIAMQEFERAQVPSDKSWETDWQWTSAYARARFQHAAEALLEWASRQTEGGSHEH